jgi:dipeptidyl aminopeptidase/acylaminoacyl peptidase
VTDFDSWMDPARLRSLAPNGVDQALEGLSPIRLVRPGLCPVLSIHGTADTVVPMDQTSRLTAQLRKAGVQATEVLVEGAGHGLSETQQDAAYQRIFEFLRVHTAC